MVVRHDNTGMMWPYCAYYSMFVCLARLALSVVADIKPAKFYAAKVTRLQLTSASSVSGSGLVRFAHVHLLKSITRWLQADEV